MRTNAHTPRKGLKRPMVSKDPEDAVPSTKALKRPIVSADLEEEGGPPATRLIVNLKLLEIGSTVNVLRSSGEPDVITLKESPMIQLRYTGEDGKQYCKNSKLDLFLSLNSEAYAKATEESEEPDALFGVSLPKRFKRTAEAEDPPQEQDRELYEQDAAKPKRTSKDAAAGKINAALNYFSDSDDENSDEQSEDGSSPQDKGSDNEDSDKQSEDAELYEQDSEDLNDAVQRELSVILPDASLESSDDEGPPQDNNDEFYEQDDFDLKNASKEELLAYIGQLKQELAYASEIVAKPLDIAERVKPIDFDQELSIEEAEAKFSESLPDDISDYDKKCVDKTFKKLTSAQKLAYFYLNDARQRTKHRTPVDHVFYGVPDIEQIKISLCISGQMGAWFGECIGDANRKTRPHNSVKDIKGVTHRSMSARTILGFVYGFDNLIGLHASHLCGNGNCLNPTHLWPETVEVNWSRDVFHANGYVSAPECKHCVPCLLSLKNGKIVKFASRIFEHVTFMLTNENYVQRKNGGMSIRLNDREYSGKGNKYECIHRENRKNPCNAYITVKGTAAIEKRSHVKGCPKISEIVKKWLSDPMDLTVDDAHELKSGINKGQISVRYTTTDGHTYSDKRGCIRGVEGSNNHCKGRIEILEGGTKAAIITAHNCNIQANFISKLYCSNKEFVSHGVA